MLRFEPREYQETIAETASKENTLCILPTGLGKTYVAILVAAKKLEEHPHSKVLVLAPSRPLVNQHMKTFQKSLDMPEDAFIALTGKIHPEKRIGIYDNVRLIFSTPQLIENDIQSGVLNLKDVTLLTVDECHRAVKNYAYPFITKKYMLQAEHPLILGLTASPGGSYEKIDEIIQNLFIKSVEIRSEVDEDVHEYVKPVRNEWVYVDFPEEFQKIKNLLEECLKERTYWLKEHYLVWSYRPSKKELLMLQKKIAAKFTGKNYSMMWAMVKVAESIKIEHAIELLETQGVFSLHEYLQKLMQSERKTDQRLMKDIRMGETERHVKELYEKGVDHPKIEKLISTIRDELKNPSVKIIVFANYRSTVDKINKLLKNEGIKSEILIGQATRGTEGLSQEKQIETLRRFGRNEFNVLVGTSISEEGLSVPDVDMVIFYESVPTEIRKIQRRGRTGRTAPGKVVFIITKGTRDEAFFWSSYHKERKMKGILYDMKNSKKLRKRKILLDWTKG
jgi:Fanconi anemia group M protein